MVIKVEFVCKYCGSGKIRKVDRTNTTSNSKIFKPTAEIRTEVINASASLGSIGRYHGNEYTYVTTQCQICLCTNVESKDKFLELCTSNERPIVVIPNMLLTRLLASRYDEKAIIGLIESIDPKLDKILENWSKQGRNPCKRNRIGYKIIIPISCLKINCWVIVDQVNTRFVLRISYGGEDIKCP